MIPLLDELKVGGLIVDPPNDVATVIAVFPGISSSVVARTFITLAVIFILEYCSGQKVSFDSLSYLFYSRLLSIRTISPTVFRLRPFCNVYKTTRYDRSQLGDSTC